MRASRLAALALLLAFLPDRSASRSARFLTDPAAVIDAAAAPGTNMLASASYQTMTSALQHHLTPHSGGGGGLAESLASALGGSASEPAASNSYGGYYRDRRDGQVSGGVAPASSGANDSPPLSAFTNIGSGWSEGSGYGENENAIGVPSTYGSFQQGRSYSGSGSGYGGGGHQGGGGGGYRQSGSGYQGGFDQGGGYGGSGGGYGDHHGGGGGGGGGYGDDHGGGYDDHHGGGGHEVHAAPSGKKTSLIPALMQAVNQEAIAESGDVVATTGMVLKNLLKSHELSKPDLRMIFGGLLGLAGILMTRLPTIA